MRDRERIRRARLGGWAILFACASGCYADHERSIASDAGAPDSRPHDAMSDASVPGCDDRDSCTDDVSIEGGCVHPPAADGTPCDDGDRCTSGDRCVAGACRGDANDRPEVLASITPRYRGAGTGVGAGRFLFARNREGGSDLFLVRAFADRFEVLDEHALSAGVSGIESLSDDFATYTTASGGALIDLSHDTIALRGRFTTGSPSREVALTDGRLWVCAQTDWLTTTLYELEASDLDALRPIGSLPIDCRSVVASSDRVRAYVSDRTTSVYVLNPVLGALASVEAIGYSAETLHAGHGDLVLTTASRITLVRESDRVELGHIDGTFGAGRFTDRGLEVLGALPGATGRTELTVFEVDEAPGAPWHERSAEVVDPAREPSGVSMWVSHDDALRTSSLYNLGHDPPFLEPVDDPDTSWPGSAIVDGTNIFLQDARRSIQIDARDPRSPFVAGGGAYDGADVFALYRSSSDRFVFHGDSTAPSVELGTVIYALPWEAPPATMDLASRAFEGRTHPIDVATHSLPFLGDTNPRAVQSVGDHLYEMTWPSSGAGSLHMVGFGAGELFEDSAPLADIDRIWPDLGQIGVIARVHDAEATAVATNDEDGASLRWLPVADADPVLTFRLAGWNVIDLAVHGGRVVAVGAHGSSSSSDAIVLAMERRGDALVEIGRREWMDGRNGGNRQILAFDGERLYAQFVDGTPELEGNLVLGFHVADLAAPPAAYPIPGGSRAVSFVRSDFGWVLGHVDGLHLLAPMCR
jgi:hypothetical protein